MNSPIDPLEQIAVRIFTQRGIDFSQARRGLGWTNATWIAGGLALRLAKQPGSQRLLREARLAALLPPAVGYPQLVESGETDGLEWVLAREVAGECLGEVWPRLSWPSPARPTCCWAMPSCSSSGSWKIGWPTPKAKARSKPGIRIGG